MADARTVGENGVPLAYHEDEAAEILRLAPTHVAFPKGGAVG